MNLRPLLIALTIIMSGLCHLASAQHVGLKSNLLADAALSPNLGVEVGLAPKWTLDLSGQLNSWNINDRRWRHALLQPEARYWFCRRFAGHFVGVHALGGQYNFGNINLPFSFLGTDFRQLKDTRHQGWYAGGGVAYGYTWILSRHWSFEAEIGVGYAYTRYDVYPCAECGTRIAAGRHHHYVGPTKAALNIVFNF